MSKDDNNTYDASNPEEASPQTVGSRGKETAEKGYQEALFKDQAELANALEEAKQKSEENWNLFLRTRADMDNFRRRSEIEVDNARKYAMERFARELLTVVDSLEHGLLVAETEHDTAYREGMTLTLKLLLDIFEKFNIKLIDPKPGDPLDPNLHEAISIQPTSEYEPNRIMVVAQKGFTMNERILRAARVIVSKSPG